MVSLDCSLLSLNVRGLRDSIKRKAILRWVTKKTCDIVFLQETHSDFDVERNWRSEWDGPVFFSHGTSNSKGCCILIKDTVDFKPIALKSDAFGRFIILHCNIDGNNLVLVNVYAPNNEHDYSEFVHRIETYISDMGLSSLDDIIMGGDWNIIRDPELDKCGGIYRVKRKAIDSLTTLILKFNLNDVWRIKNPNLSRYSWRQSQPLVQCRLDYWLISDSLFDSVTDTDIVPSIRSDHSGITLKFRSIAPVHNKPGFWKFNSSLLNEKDFTDQMKIHLRDWQEQYECPNKTSKWELIKYEIRKFSIHYSKLKNRTLNEQKSSLEKELCEIERNSINIANINRYNEIKSQLREIENTAIEGAILRSKVQWHEEGERNTKYFLGLEKNRAVKKTINKLKLKNGQTITDRVDISNAQYNYFSNLFSSKLDPNLNDFTHYFENLKKMNDDERNQCEGVLTLNECENVVTSLKKNKSPGNDGITAEFYQYFWEEIKVSLVESFNYSYEVGEMSVSQRQSIITLLDKGKDRVYLGNWRPISLLNLDYKIASKAISKRLTDFIPNIIDITQSGFVKGRYMHDSVRTLYDLIEYCKLSRKTGFLMMIDFEKAFDSLEWNFIFKTLESMNFGLSFMKWVKLFYCNIESCVLNNGFSTKYFKITRGVRQGDPLSPYLFIIALNVLSQNILQDDSIQGIRVKNEHIKLVQYADDTTAVLKDEKSLHVFINQMNVFSSISGLKMNSEKTKAIWLGETPTFILPNNMVWSEKPEKILGIYLSFNLLAANKLSFSSKINNIKNLVYSWKHRKLTLNGKVLIIKSLALSQLTYLFSVLPSDHDTMKEIEEIFYEFVWGGKIHKVKKLVLIQDYKYGGYRMIDLDSFIKVQKLKWIKLYLINHDSLWCSLMESLIKVENLKLMLRNNFSINCIITHSSFYDEIIQILNKLYSIDTSKDTTNIFNQFVFYNKFIETGGKMFFDKEFLAAGLWKVSDLFDDSNVIIPFDIWQARGVSHSKYLQWRGIISKVRCYDITRINQNTIEFCHSCIYLKTGDVINLENSTSSNIYQYLVKLKCVSPTGLLKYRTVFEDLVDREIENMYVLPRVICKDIGIHNLQYKILHRYIPTNALLFKMNKVDTNRCSYCNLHPEDILHLFFECVSIRPLWINIQDSLSFHFNTNIHFQCKDVILGYKLDESSTKTKFVNKIILHAKLFIWSCRGKFLSLRYATFKEWLQKRKLFANEINDFIDVL